MAKKPAPPAPPPPPPPPPPPGRSGGAKPNTGTALNDEIKNRAKATEASNASRGGVDQAMAEDKAMRAQETARSASGKNAEAKLKALSSSEFTRMEIISYERDRNDKYTEISRLKVGINPKDYSWSFSMPSAGKTDITKANNEVNEKATVEFRETLNFDLDFDSTGAIPDTNDVKADIAWLSDNLVEFDGEMHSTRYVKIIWGVLDFSYCQLKSMSVKFLYFDRKGEVLRAKATLSFERILTTDKKEKSSPDLTHMRVVQAGDTLPMMCNKVYKDPAYYLKVAEINGLPHFTNIQPGQKLYFPPLKT